MVFFAFAFFAVGLVVGVLGLVKMWRLEASEIARRMGPKIGSGYYYRPIAALPAVVAGDVLWMPFLTLLLLEEVGVLHASDVPRGVLYALAVCTVVGAGLILGATRLGYPPALLLPAFRDRDVWHRYASMK